MWTYEYRDKPRPCYRIQDGSDDGDVAEAWDEDIAQAICDALNDRRTAETLRLAVRRARIRLERGEDEPAIADDPGGTAKSINEASAIPRNALLDTAKPIVQNYDPHGTGR